MGLIDKASVGRSTTPESNLQPDELTLDDVNVILRVLASASFPVKDIEILYKAIFKLQMLRNKLNS